MASTTKANELRLIRVYDAPAQLVWDAWTIPEQVAKWWGPRGFTITTHSKDLRVGGHWRYTMHGPDGTNYPNVTTYFVVDPYKKLVYDHGATDETPPLFRVTVTFAEADGKTTMDMIFALATPEAAAQTAKFIKAAGGNSTWDRLAEHLESAATGATRFVVNRTFRAPIARVFEKWTSSSFLVKWLPPAGAEMRFLRSEIAPGKSTHFVLTRAERGSTYVRAEYLEIEAPQRIVYEQQFVDERDQPAPGGGLWPAKMRTTVLFVEEDPQDTRVTVTMEPQGAPTAAELDALVRERPGMTLGWTASFDTLEALLDAGDPVYYHGTKADLQVGDLLEAGRTSNFGQGKQAAYVYLTATLDAATWGAELAKGEGRGRIFVVEPTGPIQDDPNLTDKKFPGNPTKSYRTRDPLRITSEITGWQGHEPAQLQAMRDSVARLAAQGIEAIED